MIIEFIKLWWDKKKYTTFVLLIGVLSHTILVSKILGNAIFFLWKIARQKENTLSTDAKNTFCNF